MQKETLSRINYIDIAKCFAILCVIVGHTLCYDLYGFEQAWAKSELEKFIYSFHMPLFMFLSGLVSVTAIGKGAVLKDVLKRIRTLVVPFLVIGTAYSLWQNGKLDFVLVEMKSGYWYLWVLFAFYLATYPLCFGGEKFVENTDSHSYMDCCQPFCR